MNNLQYDYDTKLNLVFDDRKVVNSYNHVTDNSFLKENGKAFNNYPVGMKFTVADEPVNEAIILTSGILHVYEGKSIETGFQTIGFISNYHLQSNVWVSSRGFIGEENSLHTVEVIEKASGYMLSHNNIKINPNTNEAMVAIRASMDEKFHHLNSIIKSYRGTLTELLMQAYIEDYYIDMVHNDYMISMLGTSSSTYFAHKQNARNILEARGISTKRTKSKK